MSGFLLFTTTLVMLIVIFGCLVLLRRPVYRLTEENVVRLLELALADQATEDDWTVFIEVPIRYSDELESVRQQCAEILGSGDKLKSFRYTLSRSQLDQLERLLVSLKNSTEL